MRVGLFELRDGVTDARAGRFADTIGRIGYPWRRLIPRLRTDPDQAVVVKWDALQQGVTGLYLGGRRIEIHLSENDNHASSQPFVVAHEVGHLVDHLTFTDVDRQAIIDLFHASPETYRRDDDTLNGEQHPWSHPIDHPEGWKALRTPTYYHALHEAYADVFVQTFAPDLFPWSQPRFTHATGDFDAVRRLTLQREIAVFDDVPADHPLRQEIERAAELGLVKGFPDGTYRPGDPLTRGQAAAVAVRQYERVVADLAR